MTATEVVHGLVQHGKAMYTLSVVGNRRDDRADEREDYNLLTFRQSGMGEGAHEWSAGDSDMSLLPEHVRSIYDTTGWRCVNVYSDGDRVVFRRPPVPVPVRGSCAQKRKVFVCIYITPYTPSHIDVHTPASYTRTLYIYIYV